MNIQVYIYVATRFKDYVPTKHKLCLFEGSCARIARPFSRSNSPWIAIPRHPPLQIDSLPLPSSVTITFPTFLIFVMPFIECDIPGNSIHHVFPEPALTNDYLLTNDYPPTRKMFIGGLNWETTDGKYIFSPQKTRHLADISWSSFRVPPWLFLSIRWGSGVHRHAG